MFKLINKITFYGIKDLLRSRWIIVYFIVLCMITEGMFRFSGHSLKALSGMVSVTIFLVPLISIIFATIYYYNSRNFIELMLTQPISRKSVYIGLVSGLSFSLSLCFIFAISIPVLWRFSMLSGYWNILFLLIFIGVMLTLTFICLAFWVSISNEDKGRGLGISLLLWLTMAVVYDGLVLMVVILFQDYPLEKPMIVLMFSNPIDLARVLILLKIDVSALLGYTGAVFKSFFSSNFAQITSLLSLVAWVLFPFYFSMKKFKKIDF
ncbi:MAG: nitrous-oxide metabolic protein NosY [Calditrichaeota bacterium]|nr:MAG: nitrous-oxide metabolic protein NosY [Calditrichota bacterium]